MGKFNRNRQSGGRRESGGRNFGRRDNEPKQMFHATCSDCGAGCEVPFKPSGDKPVYCSDCFQNIRGGRDRGDRGQSRFDGGKNFDRSNFREKRMYDAVCSECGNDCQLPFEPKNDKPVFCSNCFDKKGKPSGNRDNRGVGRDNDQLSSKFDALHAKLDRILKLLVPDTAGVKAKSKQEEPKPLIKKMPESKKAAPKTAKKKVLKIKKVAVKKNGKKKKK